MGEADDQNTRGQQEITNLKCPNLDRNFKMDNKNTDE